MLKTCLRLVPKTRRTLQKYCSLHYPRRPVAAAGCLRLNAAPGVHPCGSQFRLQSSASVPTRRSTRQHVVDKPFIESLQSSLNHFGYLSENSLVHCLERLNSGNPNPNELSSANFDFLLNACVPELLPVASATKRLLIFERIWKTLEKSNFLAPEHYCTKLRVYARNRHALENIEDLILDASESTSDSEFTRSRRFYDACLDAVGACGKLKEANWLVSEMRALDFTLSERNYAALLLAHGRSGDLSGAREVLLQSLQALGETPNSAKLLSRLVACHLENNQVNEALELLDEKIERFNEQDCLTVLRTGVRVPLSDAVIKRIAPRATSGVTDLPVTLRNLLLELLHHGKSEAAVKIIEFLPAPLTPQSLKNDQAYRSATACLRYGDSLITAALFTKINGKFVLDVALALHSCGKNTRALHTATLHAILYYPRQASLFLRQLADCGKEIRPHYFYPLIRSYAMADGTKGVLAAVKLIVEFNIPFDNTVTDYILQNLNLRENPEQTLQRLEDAGVPIDEIYLTTIREFIRHANLEEAVKLCKSRKTRLNTHMLTDTLIKCTLWMGNTNKEWALATLLSVLDSRSSNARIDFVGTVLKGVLMAPKSKFFQMKTFETLIKVLADEDLHLSFNAVEDIVALLWQTDCSSKKLEELTGILNGMRCQKKVMPETATRESADYVANVDLNAIANLPAEEFKTWLSNFKSTFSQSKKTMLVLMNACRRNNQLDRALAVHKRFTEFGLEPGERYLMSLVALYIALRDLPNAERAMSKLNSKFSNFALGQNKYFQYAQLLVENDKYNVAMRTLKEASKKHKFIDSKHLDGSARDLLMAIAQYSAKSSTKVSENLTLKSFEILYGMRCCGPRSFVLEPILVESLLRGDMRGAISNYFHLAEQYEHAPRLFHLVELLGRLCAGEPETTQRFAHTQPDEAKEMLTKVAFARHKLNLYRWKKRNTTILMALAEANNEEEVQSLAKHPEFVSDFSCENLLRNSKQATGGFATLARLMRFLRGLQLDIDEPEIYETMLEHFTEINDHASARSLYRQLEHDQELQLSEDFYSNLAMLLNVPASQSNRLGQNAKDELLPS